MEIFGYTYYSPWAFWLLLIIPIVVIWYITVLYKKSASLVSPNTKRIQQVSGGFIAALRHLPFIFKMLALAFIIVALARPQKHLDDDTITKHQIEGIDIVLALDISQSMLALDFRPNRLEASKQVAKKFIEKRPNDRIGLVVYEGESYTACALTTDHESLIKRFDNVRSGKIEGGTAIGTGIATAINRLRDSEAKSKVIILLTDGENNSGKIHPLTAADYAKEFGIRVYTIGVGSSGRVKIPNGVNPFTNQTAYAYIEGKIDEQMLTQIAEKTEGKYYRAKSKTQLEKIYDEIDNLEKTKIKTLMFKKDLPEAFHKFLFVALALLLLDFLTKYLLLKSAFI